MSTSPYNTSLMNIVVLDCDGLSYEHMDFYFMKELARLASATNPQVTRQNIVINSGYLMESIFSFLTPLIPAQAARKFKFFSDNSFLDFMVEEKGIPLEQIPADYGG